MPGATPCFSATERKSKGATPMLKADVFGSTDLEPFGSNSLEEKFLRDNPEIKAAVETGKLRIHADGARTSITLASHRFAIAHVAIDLDDPSKHEEMIEKLQAQMEIIEAQIAKEPIL